MSKSEITPPDRISTEEDYDAAIKAVESLFEAKGGAWNYYYKTTVIDAHTRPSAQKLLIAMSSQARLVEPIEDDSFQPVDSLFRATHAFKAGMWTGGFISQELHDDRITYTGINNSIIQSLPHATTTTREEYEENGRFLLNVGDEGLKLIGFSAREQLDRFGNEIVSNENFRRLYALGAGAVLYTSHALYTSVHEVLQFNYDAAQLSNEVNEYLAALSDSSEN